MEGYDVTQDLDKKGYTYVVYGTIYDVSYLNAWLFLSGML